MSVAAQDLRPQIVSGAQPSAWLGVFYDVWLKKPILTKSERPLADNLAESMVNGLTAAGFKAKAVEALPTDDLSAVRAKLIAGKPDRGVLVSIKKWVVRDAGAGGSHDDYDFVVTVFGPDGAQLAERPFSGHNSGLANVYTISGWLQKGVGDAINSPEIAKALGGG